MKHSTQNNCCSGSSCGTDTGAFPEDISSTATNGGAFNGNGNGNPSAQGYQPIFNVYPKGDEAWIMEVLMPGVSKSNVKMEISGNMLTLHGKKSGCGCRGGSSSSASGKEGKDSEKGHGPVSSGMGGWKPLHQEINPNDYWMEWELGSDIDPGKIEAEMENGVLQIHLPRFATAKSKVVTVK